MKKVIYIPLGQYLAPVATRKIADRRARRPGDADLLEYRQDGVEARETPHPLLRANGSARSAAR